MPAVTSLLTEVTRVKTVLQLPATQVLLIRVVVAEHFGVGRVLVGDRVGLPCLPVDVITDRAAPVHHRVATQSTGIRPG